MKIILFANTDWYLYNFRLSLALELLRRGHSPVFLSPSGKYASRYQQEIGFPWISIKMSRRGLNPLAEIVSILNLIRIYKQKKPDLVHHFTAKCVFYGSFAAKRTGVKRVVNSITGMGYVFTQNNLFTRIVKPILNRLYGFSLKGTTVIFQNQRDMDYFIRHQLVQPSQSKLIPGSGVDVQKFHISQNKPSIPVVVLPARLLWDKGIREYYEAAKSIQAKGIKARFALIGDVDPGNPSSIPTSLLNEWKYEGIIEIWGWKEDMADAFAKASIACLPSYREGLSKVLIEAAACGLPLVSTDIPGCREIVMNGRNGFTVPIKNSHALAYSLIKLIENKALRTRMGRESRRIAMEVFSSDQINELTIKTYG